MSPFVSMGPCRENAELWNIQDFLRNIQVKKPGISSCISCQGSLRLLIFSLF